MQDQDTRDCFLEAQAIRLVPRNTSVPEVDLMSSIHSPQSASIKPWMSNQL